MPRIDLSVIAIHVRAILADPRMDPPVVGITALNEALADLVQLKRVDGRPTTALSLAPWWLHSGVDDGYAC